MDKKGEMQRESDHEFRDRLRAAGVVPVLSMPVGADPGRLAQVLTAAGLEVIEVTLRTACGLTAIRLMRQAAPAALIGAGTVLSADAAHAAIEAGALFLVSPGLHLPVGRVARTAGIPFLPGVVTPTEVGQALDEGFTLLKFFPASLAGGIPWIRALAAPYPDVEFMPTGGIRLEDVASYLAEPSVVAVGGSWIAPPGLLSGDLQEVAESARAAAAVVAGRKQKELA